MGRQHIIITFFAFLANLQVLAYDFVNVNFDKQTIEWVTLNTATQAATNKLHNDQVDSIKQRQSRLMTLVTGIAAEKELLVQTYKNVSGFKKESKYYIAIAKTSADIISHSAQAVETIENSKLAGKAMAIVNVSQLVTQAVSLGKAFSDIVANCEVPNPLDQKTGNKDKHNLLNRHERLRMANDILFRLRGIDQALRYITYLARSSGWKDLLFQLDRKTYITYVMTNINTNDIISKWQRIQN